MPEMTPGTLLARSLQGLRDLWRDLAAQGRRTLERPLRPDLPAVDLDRVRGQARDCLDGRGGEVSARQRAARLGRTYLDLDAAGRGRFLHLLASEFGTCRAAVRQAFDRYQHADPVELPAAEAALRETLVAPRVRLLTQFNGLPSGIKFLADMRADLLSGLPGDPILKTLDQDLLELLRSWLDVGFLELRRISWDSPASLLEKLIAYEAVHEIESWHDLRNRLETDRRCYAFFHHHMPGEPLIFVEVALMNEMATGIQSLLDTQAPELNPQKATSAIFYSISNTQAGLRGISFGNFLIKRVVDDLCGHFPRLKTFATLSPIPGMLSYLRSLPPEAAETALLPAERTALTAAGGDPQRSLADQLTPGWHKRATLAAALRGPLLRITAHYLLAAKRGQHPADPVARFHLGNGARIDRLNWLGDTSTGGLEQSAGIMVNYVYRLGEIERNQEKFSARGTIATARAIRQLADVAASF